MSAKVRWCLASLSGAFGALGVHAMLTVRPFPAWPIVFVTVALVLSIATHPKDPDHDD